MNLTCLKCLVNGKTLFVLDDKPRFKCESCLKEYPVGTAKTILAELQTSWEAAIKWAETAPGVAKNRPTG